MDKIEADLDARRVIFETAQEEHISEVIDSPVELFQALQPQGMTVSKPDEKKLYYLLGLLALQGINGFDFGEPDAINQTLDTVEELSELIYSAVEDYVEVDHE